MDLPPVKLPYSPPLQLVVDNSPADGGVGILSVFLTVLELPELSSLPIRHERVVVALAERFGSLALDPLDIVEKDWALDPWSTGCVTPLTTGLLSSVGPALRRPIGRVHWAGTETSTSWCGYMDGAVRSGERVASEVLCARGQAPNGCRVLASDA